MLVVCCFSDLKCVLDLKFLGYFLGYFKKSHKVRLTIRLGIQSSFFLKIRRRFCGLRVRLPAAHHIKSPNPAPSRPHHRAGQIKSRSNANPSKSRLAVCLVRASRPHDLINVLPNILYCQHINQAKNNRPRTTGQELSLSTQDRFTKSMLIMVQFPAHPRQNNVLYAALSSLEAPEQVFGQNTQV